MIRKARAMAPLLLSAVLLSVVQPAVAAEGFRVMVSGKPIHSILAALMQGADPPELIVSGRDSPYDYQLTPSQREQLRSADLLVWTGPELEPFLERPVSELGPGVRVVELLDHPALKILPSRWDSGRRDPFFWLDTRNAVILVDELARLLMDADPARAHLYLRNRRRLQAEVSEIDRRFEYGYRGMQQGVALLYYDTLQYFAQAYALRLGDVLSPLPARPIDAERLLKARAGLAAGDFACVLTETGMPAEYLPLLTEGLTVNIGELDSLGQRLEPGPALYAGLMENNSRVIRECLGKEPVEQAQAIDSATAAVDEGLGGPFLLTDHNGRLVTERDLVGHYSLLYFGYTFCPDICPTALQVMSLALDMLGDQGRRIKPWFITIDPERDRVDVMRNYVQYFNENLVGLTGSLNMIERVARQYRVRYEKVREEGGDPELYVMDHSASLFLIGPDGRFITKFAHGITPQALADALKTYLADR